MASAKESVPFVLLGDEMMKLHFLLFLGFPIAAYGNRISAGFLVVGAAVSYFVVLAILYNIIDSAVNCSSDTPPI